ncbi:zinc metalloproteinase-disintegrin-like cobrin [Panonychus citri]|uniref:zinc metalloproteinase-disintegrin-like cobrin n=1 Tax=Panonychus citri TaxID=50023 RepID=UPI002307E952|nr:zinc metalloproteinase-disintegrin-like cobrin [Panonychus citri]
MFCSFLLSMVTLLLFHPFVDFKKKIKRSQFNCFLFKQLILLITCFTLLFESVNCFQVYSELVSQTFKNNVRFICISECDSAILSFTLSRELGDRNLIVTLKREFGPKLQSHNPLSCSYIVSSLPSPSPIFIDPGDFLSGSIDRCPHEKSVAGKIHNGSQSIFFDRLFGEQLITWAKRDPSDPFTYFPTEKPHNYSKTSINPVEVKGYVTHSKSVPYHLKVVFIWYSRLANAFGNFDALVIQSNLLIKMVNTLFKPLNVIVTLMDVLNSTVQEEVPKNSSEFDALILFQKIRRDHFLPEFENFTTIFIVSSSFNGYIGFSPLGAICNPNDNAIWISWSANVTRVSASIVHELGHNLGFKNLTSEQNGTSSMPRCSKCVTMTSNYVTTFDHQVHWSESSIEKFKSLIDTGYGKCLLDPPTNYLTASCGNGIIEAGEECEWTESHPDCCHKDLCFLTEFACCGSGPCCNPSDCRPYNLTDRFICREKADPCDLPEYCDGNSEFCPEDTWIHDFYKCAGGHCFEGKCVSHKNSCNRLWNENVNQSDPTCYKLNILGKIGNDCGYDRKTQSFIPCACNDHLCGRLHCSASQNDTFRFHAWNTTHIYTNDSTTLCASSISNVYPKDPGMVPNGAACGEDRVCFNTHCLPRHTLPTYFTPYCSDDLIPDNQDQCRCPNGFSDSKSCIQQSELNDTLEIITPEIINACRSLMHANYEKLKSENSSQFDLKVFAIFFGIAVLFIIFVVFCILWLHYHPNIKRQFTVSRTPDLSEKENGEESEKRIALNSY